MSERPSCPRCHAQLSATESPEGLCPKCLLAVAMGEPEVIRTPSGSPAPPPPPIDSLAPLFPQLELVEIVGRGGMGFVYKARQRELDRVVALKILPVRAGDDPAFEERFVREARALASLSHENIVAVFDSGRAGDHYFILMEFVDGPNLRQMIRAADVTPKHALELVSQICSALEYAHGEGIVHRDIKPENVLVDRKGRVKIADFGLAKLLDPAAASMHLTRSDQAMGTLHYMAPEQMERPLSVDHRADIYSLGVVFYELLTGELPIGRFQSPSQKVEVDVRLDEVVLKTLEKEPERRYQRASDVKLDVDAISSSPGTEGPSAVAMAAASAAASAAVAAAQGHPAAHGTAKRRASLWGFGCCMLMIVGPLVTVGAYLLLGRATSFERARGQLEALSPNVDDVRPLWPKFSETLRELGLEPQERQVAKRLAYGHYDWYLKVEEQHTDVVVGDGATRIRVQVHPFSEELQRIEQELTAELDVLLNESRRAALRARIDLRELFPFGRHTVEMEITKSAGEYAVQITEDGATRVHLEREPYPELSARFLRRSVTVRPLDEEETQSTESKAGPGAIGPVEFRQLVSVLREAGLDPKAVERARSLAEARYVEYLRLERKNTLVSMRPRSARCAVEINPFLGEIQRLEDRLWSDISGLVPPDFQRNSIHFERIFPYGRQATHIEIRRENGSWTTYVSVGDETLKSRSSIDGFRRFGIDEPTED